MRLKLDLGDYEFLTGSPNYRFDVVPGHLVDLTAWSDGVSTLYLVNLDGELLPFSVGTRHDFREVVPGLVGVLLAADPKVQCAVRCVRSPTGDAVDPTPIVVQSEPTEGSVMRAMDPRVLEVALMGLGFGAQEAEEIAEEMTFDDLLDDDRDDFGPGFLEADDDLQPPVDGEPDPPPPPAVPSTDPADNTT